MKRPATGEDFATARGKVFAAERAEAGAEALATWLTG